MQTVLLVDGENCKGKIRAVFKELQREKPVWNEYDFTGLFGAVLKDVPISVLNPSQTKVFHTRQTERF